MNDVIENNVTLRNDVECILLECHRDRPGIFASSVTNEALSALAQKVAKQLGPLIAGRWVPHRYALAKAAIDERDSAVWAAHDRGSSNAEIMREFVLSRRMVYMILARKRRATIR